MSRTGRRLTLPLSLIFCVAASSCGSEFTNETPPPETPPPTEPPPPEPPPPPGGTPPLALQVVATGLDFPVYLTTPPGDSRLFVLEKSGAIRLVKDGTLVETPFLDLRGRVSLGNEQGLLGLAFPPDYASSGRFIVHYTDPAGDTRVSAFQVSANPDLADPASEVPIFSIDQPFDNHNGGQIAYGPDGFLYIGLGDGGSGNDPLGNGQSLAEPLGAILRIDPGGGTPYVVPADNPFVGVQGGAPEIWSYGLRNPWRFSFDRATGDLWVGDVGQTQWEEIDYAPAAEGAGRAVNFGWNRMEGRHCLGGDSCDQSGLALPIVEYDHDRGCSVTGGYVYRGAAIPTLQGHYFYADFCQGWVRSVRLEGGAIVEEAEWPTLAPGGSIPSFGEDAAGELYVLAGDGRVLKIVPS
jgi:glucose/arabinose dehydrogenase